MRKTLIAVVAAGMLTGAALTACDDAEPAGSSTGATGGGGSAKVGIIMPDDEPSQRWSTADAKFLQESFQAAAVPFDIQNARRDPARFEQIAREMLDNGAKVLIIVSLDPDSGKAVIDAARARKVPTIDYDRLTLNGGADYYVSFDNEQVGVLQAKGLVRCLADRGADNPVVAELNGSPTDHNATLFKRGYDSVLQPRYDRAVYTKGPDQQVPDWDTKQARRIFEQMLSQQQNIDGVLAANDGLAASVIDVLTVNGRNGEVPVTGQDATVPALRSILAGDQCMTVYKAIKPEAQAAASLAIDLFKGRQPKVTDRIKDPESGAYVPFHRLDPKAIDIHSVKDVVADGFISRAALCDATHAALCKKYGVK
ncbi:sugar ABC transporter substrate-binding protein [Micromonosporaceae bacterium Da 78-11]